MPLAFDRQRTVPLVSVVVCTKNGMPYVREAMASLERQTYRQFEVVIQDAASDDGTREFLECLQFERLDFVSEPDGGIGDAYNRAFARCSGEIVTSLDADNLLEPDALGKAVSVYRRHPRAAAFYGGVRLISVDCSSNRTLVPQAFSLAALMRCELVPPFSTSFFSRRVCGVELRCDASLTTCADFDLWLRLADHEIVRTTHVLGRTRLSSKSMSRDPLRYEQFCRDKLTALDRFIASRPGLEAERNAAIAGIYCWAAESVLEIEGAGVRFESFVDRAAALSPDDDRLRRVRDRASQAASTA